MNSAIKILFLISIFFIGCITEEFNKLEEGIKKSISLNQSSSNQIYNQLDANKKALADSVLVAGNQLHKMLDSYKNELIEMTGGVDSVTQMPIGKDNQDAAVNYFILENEGKRGLEWNNQVFAFQHTMSQQPLDSLGIETLTPQFNVQENDLSWVTYQVEHLPLAAVIANMTLQQSYIKQIELSYLKEMSKP